MIFQIKRHPIGIFGMYGMVGFLLVVLAVLAFIMAPSFASSQSKGQVAGIGAVVFMVFAFIALIFLFIANKVYWGNSWILTSDSITQVTQTSLFNKQSSQLSLNNLEDVSAEQNGLLTHMFNYGVIRAETAGERSKFMFLYCPNPNFYAQKVLQAREQFEQAGRYEAEHYQQGQAVPGSTQFTGQATPTYPQDARGSDVNVNNQ